MTNCLGFFGVAAFAAMISMTIPLQAADPGKQAAPVHGSDVMEGKNKPGQDGWSWAPTPRDQAASKSGQTPTENKAVAQDAAKPVTKGDVRLSPGQDPGTPLPTASPRPGQLNGNGG